MKRACLVLLLPALCSASKLKPAPQDNSLLQSSASCRAAFIRGILFNPDGSPKGEYKGQMEGYPRFAEDHFAGAMKKAFLNASAVLSEKERKLFGWQLFSGSVAEFRAMRGKLFNPDGSPKGEYKGQMEGYPRCAEDHFDGDMQKAFKNVSAVLTEKEMELLGWQAFHGAVAEFRAMRGKLFNPDGSPKEKYRGQMEGYPRFAEDHFAGAMQKAFQNASAVLTEKERKLFGWQAFHGPAAEFRAMRGILLNPDGSPKGEYKGQMEGYPRFAEEHFAGAMQKAFKNVSAVLTEKEMELFGWKQFQGPVALFRAMRGKLFNPDGSLKGKYKGQMEGYPRCAEDHFDGAMQKAFKNVSAVLTEKEMELFGWQAFNGSAAEFRALRGKLFNPDGSPKGEYKGQMEGYPRFAEEHFAGAMQKAFQNASAVLTEKEMELFGWQAFQGPAALFRAMRGKLFNPDGSLKGEYKGQMEGYPRFAEDHFDGAMQKAFQNVSAVLTKKEMELLGWKAFHGHVSQFHSLIEDFLEHYPKGWMGPEGQSRVADKIFKGNKITAYDNVSVLRGYLFGADATAEFRALGWRRQR